MDSATLYMLITFSTVLALGIVVLVLGLRQKPDDSAERPDVAAE